VNAIDMAQNIKQSVHLVINHYFLISICF